MPSLALTGFPRGVQNEDPIQQDIQAFHHLPPPNSSALLRTLYHVPNTSVLLHTPQTAPCQSSPVSGPWTSPCWPSPIPNPCTRTFLLSSCTTLAISPRFCLMPSPVSHPLDRSLRVGPCPTFHSKQTGPLPASQGTFVNTVDSAHRPFLLHSMKSHRVRVSPSFFF